MNQFDDVRQPLLESIKNLEGQIDYLRKEMWQARDERDRLIGFLAGTVDIAADDLEDTEEIAGALALPFGDAKREQARRRWNELVHKRCAITGALYND